ncbi:MAG: hypothetical protein GYA36_12325 [Veillonellaceae bacterium]|nr:hypothetical protein [Veillonellaceae bacterium]
MLTVTLTVIALAVVGVVVWIAARRTHFVQRVSGDLSGPVEQMREQILLTADTAVDRLDGKIAQMEILLAEIDRRSTALVQQSKQQQLAKLQLEQQQQQLATWLQSQRQLLETEIQRRQQEWVRLQTTSANGSRASAPIEAPTVSLPSANEGVQPQLQPPQKLKTNRIDSANFRQEHSDPRPDKPSAPASDKRAVILEMSEQGYSVMDIAQKLGIGKGEVMLLLKLRKRVAT